MNGGSITRGIAAASAAVLVMATAATADPPTYETGFIPVAVGTPDETTLHYKVILPDPEVWGPGPYPAVIDYSGYYPAITIFDGLDDRFHDAGYAVVGINIRGSSCSGGKFDYFEPRQAKDGAEAIEWLAENRGADDEGGWSNGDFGMVGKSYPGITQLFVAAEQPEHLRGIVPGHVFGDLYRDVPFPGGILNLTFSAGWSLQRNQESFLVGPGYYLGVQYTDPAASQETKDQCLRNQADHAVNPVINPFVQATYNQYDGPLFHERSPWYFADEIDVPTFLVEAWQDEQVGSRATHLLERLRTDEIPWKFMAANGDHGEYYGEEMFPRILRFVDYYVGRKVPANDPCDQGLADPDANYEASLACYQNEDPVIINWENGAEGGRRGAWTTTYTDWPPPHRKPWRLFLRPDGTLTQEEYPEVDELSRVEILNARNNGAVDYVYVPEVGSQERGGYNLVGEPEPTWEDRPPEGTSAAFTSAPLGQDRVLLGPASLDLWIGSTAPDTDFEVTLSEVRPDGQEVFVQQGWLRASHRMEDSLLSTELRPYQTHRLTDSALLLPGQPTKVRIEIFPFGHTFRAGSRIRIAVAAPHLQPDLWGFLALPVPAVNTIYASEIFPSSLALPLLEGETAGVDSYPPCTLRNQPCRSEPES